MNDVNGQLQLILCRGLKDHSAVKEVMTKYQMSAIMRVVDEY